MLNIRRATKNDVGLIANLSRKTFFDTYHEQNTSKNMAAFLETNFSDAAIELEVKDPKNIFLVAELEGDAVGYARLSERENPFEADNLKAIEVCRIYALKDKIGMGIGKALIQYSVELAREGDYDMIWLGVWERNERAINFYTGQGFEKFGEHNFMLGNDVQNDWLMKKTIR
jgi:ribosomal protein S18 acetylase RimI-like enzyme